MSFFKAKIGPSGKVKLWQFNCGVRVRGRLKHDINYRETQAVGHIGSTPIWDDWCISRAPSFLSNGTRFHTSINRGVTRSQSIPIRQCSLGCSCSWAMSHHRQADRKLLSFWVYPQSTIRVAILLFPRRSGSSLVPESPWPDEEISCVLVDPYSGILYFGIPMVISRSRIWLLRVIWMPFSSWLKISVIKGSFVVLS